MHSKEWERTCKLLPVIYKFFFITLLFLLLRYPKNRSQVQASPLNCQEPTDMRSGGRFTADRNPLVLNEWNLHYAHHKQFDCSGFLKIQLYFHHSNSFPTSQWNPLLQKGTATLKASPFIWLPTQRSLYFKQGLSKFSSRLQTPGQCRFFSFLL